MMDWILIPPVHHMGLSTWTTLETNRLRIRRNEARVEIEGEIEHRKVEATTTGSPLLEMVAVGGGRKRKEADGVPPETTSVVEDDPMGSFSLSEQASSPNYFFSAEK
ncbi:hypothetical protein L1887_05936 [Cichorium endivia]|nr:hypothetical protein L1887_05936 [Cichorium endivia]